MTVIVSVTVVVPLRVPLDVLAPGTGEPLVRASGRIRDEVPVKVIVKVMGGSVRTKVVGVSGV